MCIGGGQGIAAIFERLGRARHLARPSNDRALVSGNTRRQGGREKQWLTTPRSRCRTRFRSTIRKSQDTVIDAIKTWVETVQSVTPKVPSMPVPGADKLPKPEELGSSAYDFAEQLLAGQCSNFAEEVLKATSSLMPGT